jgi:hypothetical protein
MEAANKNYLVLSKYDFDLEAAIVGGPAQKTPNFQMAPMPK